MRALIDLLAHVIRLDDPECGAAAATGSKRVRCTGGQGAVPQEDHASGAGAVAEDSAAAAWRVLLHDLTTLRRGLEQACEEADEDARVQIQHVRVHLQGREAGALWVTRGASDAFPEGLPMQGARNRWGEVPCFPLGASPWSGTLHYGDHLEFQVRGRQVRGASVPCFVDKGHEVRWTLHGPVVVLWDDGRAMQARLVADDDDAAVLVHLRAYRRHADLHARANRAPRWVQEACTKVKKILGGGISEYYLMDLDGVRPSPSPSPSPSPRPSSFVPSGRRGGVRSMGGGWSDTLFCFCFVLFFIFCPLCRAWWRPSQAADFRPASA